MLLSQLAHAGLLNAERLLLESQGILVDAVIADCSRELQAGRAKLICSVRREHHCGGRFTLTVDGSDQCPRVEVEGACVVYPTDRDTLRVDDIRAVSLAWESSARALTGKQASAFGVWVAELLNACPQADDMLAELTDHWGWREEQSVKRSALAAQGNSGRGTL